MPGNECVRFLCHRRDAGKVVVHYQRPPMPGTVSERPKHRLGTAVNLTFGLDELDGLRKTFRRYFWKLRGDARVLRRQVIDAVLCGLLPAGDPKLAEVAIAVIDEQRFRRRR